MDSALAKLFEHNNWTNLLMLDVCARLTDAQLDAKPRSVTKGTIRETLSHLVRSQQGYLRLLTGIEPPFTWEEESPPPLERLRESLELSGQQFLELARDEANRIPRERRRTRDNWWVEPWVPVVQAINHATEHREQISSMLTDLGLTPPEIDVWAYAEFSKAMTPAG